MLSAIWSFVGVLFAVAVFGVWRTQRGVRSDLEAFARDNSLEYLETGWFGFHLTGTYRGRKIELNRAMKQVGNRTSYKLMLEYRVPLKVDLSEDFVIRDFQSQRYEGVKVTELEVNTRDSAFESQFSVQSTDKAAAFDVLDDEMRGRLLAHQAAANIFKLQPTSRFVRFDGGELRITTFRLPSRSETIFDRLDEVMKTAEMLETRLKRRFPTEVSDADRQLGSGGATGDAD
jgi:hypothetical protein